MFKAILWKEWHEQRWRVIFGLIMLNFFMLSLLNARVTSEHETTVFTWIFGGLFLSLLSAMGTFATETTHDTWKFYLAKPVPVWKITLAKWFVGWLGIIIPLLVSLVIFLIFSNMESMRYRMSGNSFPAIKAFIASASISTMFYTLTCSLAPRKAGEAYVGLIGLLIFAVITLHMLLTEALGLGNFSELGVPVILWSSVNPFFMVAFVECSIQTKLWVFIIVPIVQSLIFVSLLYIAFRKYKRSA